MANVYDAIVIGGGHNGLISAGFFAKAGARTVVLEARDKTGGAADTSSPWPEHPDFRVTTYSYVMSLMPPTVIQELAARAARLQGHAVRPVLPGVPGRALDQDLRGRREEELRVDLAVLQEGRRGDPEVGRVALGRRRRDGAAAAAGPAAARLAEDPGPARPAPRGVEGAGARRPRRRRRHEALHDERERPAERVVRVRPGQGHAHGERRHRHVGRPRLAGHRLRDAPPLDRRRRRRPPRLLGLPGGRHGRRLRRVPAGRRVVRGRGPHRGEGREDPRTERPGGRRRARERRGAPGAGRRHDGASRGSRS